MVVLIGLSFLTACSSFSKKSSIESQGNDFKIVIRDKDSSISEARAWEEAKEFCEQKGQQAVITKTDSKAIGAVSKKPPTVVEAKKKKSSSGKKADPNELSQAFVSVAQKEHESVLYFQCI